MEIEQMKTIRSKLPATFAICLVLVSAAYVRQETAFYTTGENVSVNRGEKCVVIDAGHGGGKQRYHAIKDIAVKSTFADIEINKNNKKGSRYTFNRIEYVFYKWIGVQK